MTGQLVIFCDADNPNGAEVARLYLEMLPPVGATVHIEERRIGDDSRVQLKIVGWMVARHHWHIVRTQSGEAGGWHHSLPSAFVYLKRAE